MSPISWPGLLRYVPWLLMAVSFVGPQFSLWVALFTMLPHASVPSSPFHRLLAMSSSDLVGEIFEELNPCWIGKPSNLSNPPFSVLPVRCLHTRWDALVFIVCFAVQVSS